MASGKGAAPKAAPDSAKTKALRSLAEALKDEDFEGAAKALDVAISCCMGEGEEESEEE